MTSDQQRKAIFASLAKRNKASKLTYPLSKKDMAGFNHNLIQIKNIRPDTYLYLTQADAGINIFRRDDVDSLNKILQRIEHKQPLDIPILEANLKTKQIANHDGRHRALGSMLEGIKIIPVAVVGVKCNKNDSYCNPIPIQKMTKKEREILNHPEKLKPQENNFVI